MPSSTVTDNRRSRAFANNSKSAENDYPVLAAVRQDAKHIITDQIEHLLPASAQTISPKTISPHRRPLATTQLAIHR